MNEQVNRAIELIACKLVNDTIHMLQMQGLAGEDCGEFTAIPRQYIDQILHLETKDYRIAVVKTKEVLPENPFHHLAKTLSHNGYKQALQDMAGFVKEVRGDD